MILSSVIVFFLIIQIVILVIFFFLSIKQKHNTNHTCPINLKGAI